MGLLRNQSHRINPYPHPLNAPALPLPPNSAKKPSKASSSAAAPPTDPGSLLLLDDENGVETWEDLSRPPQAEERGDRERGLLAVQAAGAEMEVLRVSE